MKCEKCGAWLHLMPVLKQAPEKGIWTIEREPEECKTCKGEE